MARQAKRRRTRRGKTRRVRTLLAISLWAMLALFAIEQPVLVAISLIGSTLLVVTLVAGGRWRQRRTRLQRTRTLDGLLALTPADFELAIGELFRSLGYQRLRRVGGAGDLGVDLIGCDSDGRPVIVQCKRYGFTNRVGSPAIQTFLGMVVHHGAERGIFVTTSDYTAPAIALAGNATVPITLVDGPEIIRLAAYAREQARLW
jgi:HJR/Mrr/RecB family endonuclease